MNLDPNQIAETIDRLIKANLKSSGHTYKRGIVSAFSHQTADVKVEGNTTATQGIICIDSYKPFIGDKVLILSIGESGANLIVLGKLTDTPKVTKWNNIAFQNGAANWGSGWPTFQYRKGSDGRVQMKGLVKNSNTTGQVIGTLPAGFRPSFNMHIAVLGDSGLASVHVNSNGDLIYRSGSGSTGWHSWDNVSFQAEQ